MTRKNYYYLIEILVFVYSIKCDQDLFEFDTPQLNYTLFYSSANFQQLKIIRKSSSFRKILLEYDLIEYRPYPIYSTNYLEFQSDQNELFFNFTYNKYDFIRAEKRSFSIKLISSNNNRNRSEVYIQVINDLRLIYFTNTSFEVLFNNDLIITNFNISLTLNQIIDQQIKVSFITVPSNDDTFDQARPLIDYLPVTGYFTFLPNTSISQCEFKIFKNKFYPQSSKRMFRIYLLKIEDSTDFILTNDYMQIFINWNKAQLNDLISTNLESINYLNPLNISSNFCFTNKIKENLIIIANLESNEVNLKLENNHLFLESGQECLNLTFDKSFINNCFNLKLNLTLTIVLANNLKIQLIEHFEIFFSNKNCSKLKLNLDNIRINDIINDVSQTKSVNSIEIDLTKFNLNDINVKLPILDYENNVKYRLVIDYFIEEVVYLKNEIKKKLKRIDYDTKSLVTDIESIAVEYIEFYLSNLNFYRFSSLDLRIEIVEEKVEKYFIDPSQKVIDVKFKINNHLSCSNFGFNKFASNFLIDNFGQRKFFISFINSNNEQCSVSLIIQLAKLVIDDKGFVTFLDTKYIFHVLTLDSNTKTIYIPQNLLIDINDRFILRFSNLNEINLNTIKDSYLVLNATNEISNNGVIFMSKFIDDMNLEINFMSVSNFQKSTTNYDLFLRHPLFENNKKINVTRQLMNKEENYTIGFNLKNLESELNFFGDIILESNRCDEFYSCYDDTQDYIVENHGLFGFIQKSIEIRPSLNLIEIEILRYFASTSNVKLLLSLVSLDSYKDLYFSNYDPQIEFQFYMFVNKITLNINRIFTVNHKIFYIYLTNVLIETNLSKSSKISKYNDRLEIQILPSPQSDLDKLVYFSKNYLKIYVITDKFDLTIPIHRLSSDNELSVNVKSTDDYIPDYIMRLNYDYLKDLAESDMDYNKLDTSVVFKDGEILSGINLSLHPKFTNLSKIIFVYLYEPSNEAQLIEPNALDNYSPYVKIELVDKIFIGFLNKHNQSFNQINKEFIIDFFLSKTIIYSVKYQIKLKMSLIDSIEGVQNILNCPNIITECQQVFVCDTLQNCKFSILFLDEEPTNYTLKIEIIEINKLNENSLIIETNLDSYFYLYIYSTRRKPSYVQVDSKYLFNLNNRLQLKASVKIVRKNNLKDTLTVYYSTNETQEWRFSPHIKIYRSEPEIDFDLIENYSIFKPYESQIKIELEIKNSYEKDLYPIMFRLILLRCEPDCFIVSNYSFSNITILNDNIYFWDFYLKSFNGYILDYDRLLQIFSSLNTISETQHDLLIKILENTDKLDQKNTVLRIYCILLSYEDKLGKIEYLNLLENYLIKNVNGLVMGKEFFNINCPKSWLNYNCLESSKQLRYIGENYQVLDSVDSVSKTCFVEFENLNFLGNNKNDLLLNKALLIKRDNQLTNSEIQLNLTLNRNIQTDKKCAIYNQSTNVWDFEYCTTRKFTNRIECKCNHRSIYGFLNEPNKSYYGFNNGSIYASLSFVIFIGLVTLVTYKTCLKTTTFLSTILMNFIISIVCTHVLYLITIIISHLVIGQEPYEANSSCLVLSLFFHYFILSQFSSMLAICLCIYLILARGVYQSFRFRQITRLIVWSLPLLIISIFYLITGLVYEKVHNYSAFYVYGDIFENKELCFIKNIWAYLAGCILPCTLMFISSVCLIIRIFRGDTIHNRGDIYVNQSNFKQILNLSGLFCLVFLLNLFAALHIRFGSLGLLVVFCIFDFLLGLYILVFYVFKNHVREFFRIKENDRKQGSQEIKNLKKDLKIVTQLGSTTTDLKTHDTKQLIKTLLVFPGVDDQYEKELQIDSSNNKKNENKNLKVYDENFYFDIKSYFPDKI